MEGALRAQNPAEAANPFHPARELPKEFPPTIGEHLYKELLKVLPDKDLPTPLGKGGEHLVFEFQDRKNNQIVYKVNYRNTLDVISAARKNNTKEVRRIVDHMRSHSAKREHELNKLREYFGFDSVPVQYSKIVELPVTSKIIFELSPREITEGLPESLPAQVIVQRRVDLPPDAVSINGYYPEADVKALKGVKRYEAEERLDAAHRILIEPYSEDLSPVQRKLILDVYPELGEAIKAADKDLAFRQELENFVRNLIHYVTETGKALDLAGHNNVVITKISKKWKLKLLDALLGDDLSLTRLGPMIERLNSGKELSRYDALFAVNLLNTIRVTNALAGLLDMPERIEFGGLAQVPAEKWRENLIHVVP